MRTLNNFIKRKFSDADFKRVYDRECHVCAYTIRIFEKAEQEGLSDNHIAALLKANPARITDLREAEHCDPELVHALCERLDLSIPKHCPRRVPKNTSAAE